MQFDDAAVFVELQMERDVERCIGAAVVVSYEQAGAAIELTEVEPCDRPAVPGEFADRIEDLDGPDDRNTALMPRERLVDHVAIHAARGGWEDRSEGARSRPSVSDRSNTAQRAPPRETRARCRSTRCPMLQRRSRHGWGTVQQCHQRPGPFPAQSRKDLGAVRGRTAVPYQLRRSDRL